MVLAVFAVTTTAKWNLAVNQDPVWGGLVTFTLTTTTATTSAFSFEILASDVTDPDDFFLQGASDATLTGLRDDHFCYREGKRVAHMKVHEISQNLVIDVTLDTTFAVDDVITCSLRLVPDGTQTGVVTFSAADGIVTDATLPPPTQAIKESQFLVAFSDGVKPPSQSDAKLPKSFSAFDLSSMTIKYTAIPKNIVARVLFSIVSLDDIQVEEHTDEVEEFKQEASTVLTSMTSKFMEYGFGSVTAQCSQDVRLYTLNSEIFIATGPNPADGSCVLPFSRTAIGLLGFVYASDQISTFFDVAPLIQSAVDVRVHIGPVVVKVGSKVEPLFPNIDAAAVEATQNQNEINVIVSGYVPEDKPKFEISVKGLAKSALDKLKGAYGSLRDFIQDDKDTNPQAKIEQLLMSPTDLRALLVQKMKSQSILEDFFPSTKATILDLKAGFAAASVKIQTEGVVDPINIEIKFAGKKHHIVYQPVARILDATVTSATDEEINFVVKFDNKNIALGKYPLFNPQATTKVEYAMSIDIAPWNTEYNSPVPTHWELRANNEFTPTCTSSHPDISTESASLAIDEDIDGFTRSFLRVTGKTVVSDKWELTCTQKLNPEAKPTSLSDDDEFQLVVNIFNRWSGLETAMMALEPEGLHLPVPIKGKDVTWTHTELVKENGLDVTVQYEDAINNAADFDKFMTDLIAHLKAGTMDGDDVTHIFATLTKDQIFYQPEKPQSSGSTFTPMVLNTFTNTMIESYTQKSTQYYLVIKANPPIDSAMFALYEPAWNSKFRLEFSNPSNTYVIKSTPATLITTSTPIQLGSAVNGACISTTQCPQYDLNMSYCYKGTCTDHIALPAAVRSSVDYTSILPQESPYFSNNNIAPMIMFAIVLALFAIVF